MSWHYARVDHLAPGAVCMYCARSLKSLKGIVITDGHQEAYAGPNCAKKHLGPPDERLLDVARLALLVVSDGDPDGPLPAPPLAPTAGSHSVPRLGGERSVQPSAARSPLPPLDAVVQYLRLRYEAMSGFRYQRSSLLTEAYEAFQATGQLDEVQRKRVAGAMRSSAEQQTVFSPRNVKFCIGLNYWLSEAIQHTAKDRRGFLEAMVNKLHQRWSLSEAQIEAINKWFAGVRKREYGLPHLEVKIFKGVVIPDFMIPARKSLDQ